MKVLIVLMKFSEILYDRGGLSYPRCTSTYLVGLCTLAGPIIIIILLRDEILFCIFIRNVKELFCFILSCIFLN